MRTTLEILFLRQSRFAQMDMRIDEAGQQLFAAGIDDVARRGSLARRKESNDPPVPNANIRKVQTACVDNCTASDQRVEHIRLRSSTIGPRASALRV